MATKGEVRIIVSAQEKATRALKRVTNAISGLVTAYISLYGARKAIGVIQDVVKEASDQEVAIAKLSQQLKNHNEYTQENVEALKDQADALQRVTKFSDEQILSAQAMLGSFSLTKDEIIATIPRLLDAAVMNERLTGTQIDLATVAKMVGVALGGQAGRLVQMGIKMTNAQRETYQMAREQDRLNILLEIFDSNAKGLAESVGATFQGKLARMRNLVGEVKERFGQMIITSEAVNVVFETISDKLTTFTNALDDNEEAMHDWANMAVIYLVEGARFVAESLLDLTTATVAVAKAFVTLGEVQSYFRIGGEKDRIMMQGFKADLDAIGVSAQETKIKLQGLSETLVDDILQAMADARKEAGKLKDELRSIPPPPDPLKGLMDKETTDTLEKKFARFAELADRYMVEPMRAVQLATDKAVVKQIRGFEEIRMSMFQYSVDFANNIIDSIVEGRAEWDKFVIEFIKGVMKMFVKMMVMKALMAVFNITTLGLPLPFGKGGVVPKMQHGGVVPGASPYRDRVPALLTPGEYVMSRATVNRLGTDNLERINRGETFHNKIDFNISVGGAQSDGSVVAYQIVNVLEREFPRVYREAIRRRQII